MTRISEIGKAISYHVDILMDVKDVLFSSSFMQSIDIVNDLQRIEEAAQQLKSTAQSISNLPKNYETSQEFLSQLLHDLRIPIDSIKGYGEIILEDLKQKDPHSVFIITVKDLVAASSYILELIESITGNPHSLEDAESFVIVSDNAEQRASILLLDNDQNSRDILYRRLIREGHRVQYADDIKKGWELIIRQNFDLILVDFSIMSANKVNILTKIKSNEKYKNTPVIVISAIDDIANFVQCIRMGAEDYLVKPFNSVILKARINASLNKKQMYDKEKQYLKELDAAKVVLETAIGIIGDGFALFDNNHNLKICNKAFQDIYKINDTQNLRYKDIIGKTNPLLDKKFEMEKDDKESHISMIHDRVIKTTIYNMPNSGIVTIHKDVTEQYNQSRQLSQMAFTDTLTGIPNRNYFRRYLSKITEKSQEFFLCFIDLNNFKQANDKLGHSFGDFILIEIAQRIKNVLKEDEIVARLGGDEFACILNLKNAVAKDELTKRLDDIHAVTKIPIAKDEHSHMIGMSIGVASYPTPYNNVAELMSAADMAMYDSKANKIPYVICENTKKVDETNG